MGTCYNRYCWGFNRLGVDGWLLVDLDSEALEKVLGVDDAKAREAILGRLKG